jgi:hypothetical protein
LDAVLLTFKATGVIPPVVAPDGYRQVGLLGACLDLVEDPLPQRFKLGGRLVGVLVLGFQMRDDFGTGLVSQPFIRVDEHVAVEFPSALHSLGDGRCCPVAHAPGPIQSSKRSPEIRS